MKDELVIGGRKFSSRLLIGSGKFSSNQVMKKAILASGSEIVTMALRRIDLYNPKDDFMEVIEELEVLFLPNTSGARNAADAVRLAEMTKNLTGNEWLKLEVTPDPKYLLPDPIETLLAAEILIKKGFKVLPYINADPILAKRLEEAGCVTIMPLGSPIGSNQGLKTKEQIKIIISRAHVPVVVDAGIGAPSHAALAMELGASAVLVNTAIATSNNPVLMAKAFKMATESGRMGYLSQLSDSNKKAQASSPLTGFPKLNN